MKKMHGQTAFKFRNKELLTDNSVVLWWVTAGPQARHRLRCTHHTTSKLSLCDLIVNLVVVVNLALCKELIIHYLLVRFVPDSLLPT